MDYTQFTLTASGVDDLTADDCWQLLAGAHIGRLAVIGADDAPDVFPLDYLVHDHRIYVRTRAGVKTDAFARQPRVAFEADEGDELERWSVVIRGVIHPVTDPAEIAESGIAELGTSTEAYKPAFYSIHPVAVSGRRFRPHHETPVATGGSTQRRAADAPNPVPHYLPLRGGAR